MRLRWEGRAIEASQRVSVVVGVSEDPVEISAMKQAADAAVNNTKALRIRRWLQERACEGGAVVGFARLIDLHADYNAWADRNDTCRLSEKALSQWLVRLGIEKRDHPRTRRSEFRLSKANRLGKP